MTVSRFAGDRYTGLSTDTKPTNVLDGATFYELDTTAEYVFFNGEWLVMSDKYNETIATLGY